MVKRKEKKCRVCPNTFVPRTSLHVVCSPECSYEWTYRERARKAADFKRAGRKRIRTRHEHIKLAQAEFNAWVKLRDSEQPCISCGTTGAKGGLKKSGWDAGHYRTTGSCPELRFDPLNCHKQCVACNQHKSGNIVEYRKGLIERIGEEKVAWLEGPHEAKKYTIEELKGIRDEYKAKRKELRAAEA